MDGYIQHWCHSEACAAAEHHCACTDLMLDHAMQVCNTCKTCCTNDGGAQKDDEVATWTVDEMVTSLVARFGGEDADGPCVEACAHQRQRDHIDDSTHSNVEAYTQDHLEWAEAIWCGWSTRIKQQS